MLIDVRGLYKASISIWQANATGSSSTDGPMDKYHQSLFCLKVLPHIVILRDGGAEQAHLLALRRFYVYISHSPVLSPVDLQ